MAFSTPQQIAAKLCNPQAKHRLVVIADSLLTAMEPYVFSVMPQVRWTGAAYLPNAANSTNAAHTSLAGTAAINQACASPYIGGRQYWYPPQGGTETRFSGTTEPSAGPQASGLTRLNNGPSSAMTNWPLLAAQLRTDPRVVRVKHVYYKHAGGMSANPGIRLAWQAQGFTNFNDPNCYQGSYVYDVTGSGYGTLEVVIPSDFPWINQTAFSAFVSATPAGTTVNLQTTSVSRQSLEQDGPGIVYDAWAQGGWNVGGWLDNTEVPTSLFTTYLPLFTDSPIFWLDLGANGTSGITTAEQHAAAMELLIAKCRSGFPEADILLTSSHAHSTSGSNPIYRAGAELVAASVPGVLYLDTYGALPTYAQGVALGYYGDTVHYLPAGNTNKFTVIGGLIYSASVTGLPLTAGVPTITAGTLTQRSLLVGTDMSAGVPTITAGTLSTRPPPLRIVNLTYKWRATQSTGTPTAAAPAFTAYRGHALDMGVFTVSGPAGFEFTDTVAQLRIGRIGDPAHVEWRSDDVPSGVLFAWDTTTGELAIDMPSSEVDQQLPGRYAYQLTIISSSGEPLGPPLVNTFRILPVVGAMA